MITGAIKNKVDKIWTDIWAGGITNPLTVIEQLTYLMFIRSLDEKELETEEFENMTGKRMVKIFPQSAIGQSMRWGKFKNNDPRDIYDVISQRVFPAIKNMKHGRLPDFTEQGELVEVSDESGRDEQNNTCLLYTSHGSVRRIHPLDRQLQRLAAAHRAHGRGGGVDFFGLDAGRGEKGVFFFLGKGRKVGHHHSPHF